MIGSFTFVLHSHLPYVINHGEWPHGTDWLNEAAAETYIPLLRELNSLVEDGIRPAVTLGITPVLMEQLNHPRFKAGFNQYLQQKIDSAITDENHFKSLKQNHLASIAVYWREYYQGIGSTFAELQGNILAGFRKLVEEEAIEMITSGATHGYFPLLGTDESISAQIATGIQTFEKHIGCKPKGIWLPECAYRPAYEWSRPTGGNPQIRSGIEELLYEQGIEYFIVDKHLIMGGTNKGVYIDRFESLQALWGNFSRGWNPPAEIDDRSVFKPYLTSSTGSDRWAAVYGRHEDSAMQVWSAKWGYPGNPAYLDFHKKHFPGGHKYWRVTGRDKDLAEKEMYQLEWINATLEEQSEHFAQLVADSLGNYKNDSGETGIITAPFDTELFGHWWFEGVRWLGLTLRKLSEKNISATTCGKYLVENPPKETISIPEGSWGQGGFHYIWLNEWTEWTWKVIYPREDRFRELADSISGSDDKTARRIVKQMGRELLLLESSDWQFLISTWSARDYAEARIDIHAERFDELEIIYDNYRNDGCLSDLNWQRLQTLEEEDSIFPDLNVEFWESRKPVEKQ